MRILLYFLLFVSLASQVSGEPISRHDFSGGMNTRSSIFGLADNEVLRLQNYSISSKDGGVTKRNGILAMSSPLGGLWVGTDSLIAGPNDNGDLEDWTSGLPEDWDTIIAYDEDVPYPTISISEETSNVYEGSSAFKILISATGVGTSFILYDSIILEEGESYRFSAMIDVDNMSSPSRAYLYINYDSTGQNTANIYDNTTGYINLLCDFIAPSGSVLFGVGCDAYQGSTDTSIIMYVDSVSLQKITRHGGNPIIGLFGATYRDGSKTLYTVRDPDTLDGLFYGLGELVASPDFSYQTSTGSSAVALFDYIYTGETPYWLMWKNSVLGSNGRQAPWIVYNDSCRRLIPQAPGEPNIYPINDDSVYWNWVPPEASVPITGNLLPDGEYRYAVVMQSYCGYSYGSELVTNGGFETWASGDPSSWTIETGDNNNITQNTDSVSGGSNSALFCDTGTYVMVHAYQDISTSIGSDYVFTIQSNILNGFLAFIVSGADELATGITYSNESETWATLTSEFTADATTTRIDLYASASGESSTACSTFVDDASLKLVSAGGSTYQESYLSQPIKVYGEKLLLSNFTFRTVDSICDDPEGAGFDNVDIEVYRTKAYPGMITVLDTMYKVFQYSGLDSANFDTLYFIDSIPDSFLGVYSPYTTIHIPDMEAVGYNGRTTSDFKVRVGAPTFMGRNFGGGQFIFMDSVADTSYGIRSHVMIHTDYFATLFDTLINAESDSSRILRIYTDTAEAALPRDTNYIIGLPPVPSGSSHLARNLYRSMTYLTISDSSNTFVMDSIRDSIIPSTVNPANFINYVKSRGAFISEYIYWNGDVRVKYYANKIAWPFVQDTITTAYFRIGELLAADVDSFVDTITFDSAIYMGKPFLHDADVPNDLKITAIFSNAAWAFDGSVLYWSALDSGSYWRKDQSLVLNPDDGDEITAVIPYRKFLKVFKNMSQFLISFVGSQGIEYSDTWIENGVGCVSPRSLAFHNGELLYLSHLGVIQESGAQYLEKGRNGNVISYNVNNILLDRPMSELKTATHMIRGEEYRLSFPSTDTTWVYNLETGGWSIFTYSFTQTTLYDTTKHDYVSPSNELLFIAPGSDRVFKVDTLYTDSTQPYYSKLQTKPLLTIPGTKYQVRKVGVWGDYDNVWGGVVGDVINMSGNSTASLRMDRFSGFEEYGLQAIQSDESMYHTILIGDTILLAPVDSVTILNNFESTINGIDVWIDVSNEIKGE